MCWLYPTVYAGTWEEQVGLIPPRELYGHEPLGKRVDTIVNEGFGKLFGWDRSVEFRLTFDQDLRQTEHWYSGDFTPEQHALRPTLQLGKVQISIRYPEISQRHHVADLAVNQVPREVYLLHPSALAHVAMAHRVGLLCEWLRPVFAVGYYSTTNWTTGSTDPSDYDETLFITGFDIAMIQALEAGTFPPLDRWLRRTYLLYTPETLMARERIEEWLRQPQRWSRHLSVQEGG